MRRNRKARFNMVWLNSSKIKYSYIILQLRIVHRKPSYASLSRSSLEMPKSIFIVNLKQLLFKTSLGKKALFEANEVNNDAIYLPVSVPGPIIKKKSSFLHEKFNIPNNKKNRLVFWRNGSSKVLRRDYPSRTNAAR